MEDLVMPTASFWQQRRVFVTGHTGFKGGWLTLWLTQLGAQVYGYGLPPATDPALFDVCGLATELAGHTLADIRDADALSAALRAAAPDVVFHLAAQPLVRYSYEQPGETYAVNVMGTLNLLEAVRSCPRVRAVVNVTSDKCYENREWLWPYREDEPLGGHDPYSSSKACVEIVSASYRRSFFQHTNVALATARAGNVIGGGDWATDRLVPDFFRAADRGESLRVRSPDSVRPWQHVLEPLSGYLRLAECLYLYGQKYAQSWNFGPAEQDVRSVQWVAETLCHLHGNARWERDGTAHPHEAATLRLDSSKARARLSWQYRWPLVVALRETVDWHRAWRSGTDMRAFSGGQAQRYLQAPSA